MEGRWGVLDEDTSKLVGLITASKFLGTVNYTGNKTYTNVLGEVVYGNFMTRVPKVLGEVTAPKFLGTVKYTGNKTYNNVLG
jgi:hypothetical protein